MRHVDVSVVASGITLYLVIALGVSALFIVGLIVAVICVMRVKRKLQGLTTFRGFIIVSVYAKLVNFFL